MIPPMLIALPRGLCVSGVTLWAARLADAIVKRGGRAGLIVHGEDPGCARLDLDIDQRVRIFDLRHLPPLESAEGDLSPCIPRYREAVEAMAGESPVVLSPNLLGDCYGICAALSQTMSQRVRIVGWQHSDIPYDARVLSHYAPMLSAFVGVSEHIAAMLRARLPARAVDCLRIPYGVEVCEPPQRESLKGRPIRLLYTGRIEHPQKRIGAMVRLADELSQRGIDHELTLVGDGPAAGEIDAEIADRPTVRRIGPRSPAEIRRMLEHSDLFVLASRYEGLSVSMLEALAAGCVPVMTRVRSGASEAVRDGENGILADNEPDDERAIARHLAAGVERVLAIGLDRLSSAAWRSARERYGIDRHADLVGSMLANVALSPARPWLASRPCAFTGLAASCSPVVPADGAERLRRVLASLAGRTIVIHGAGRHTIELAPVLAEAPCEIVAICDDDPARWNGSLLGWPIIAPADAAAHGATDAVISSHMHEAVIWSRGRVYLDRGVQLHGLYSDLESTAAEAA